MTAVGERSHLDILSGTPPSRLRFRDNAATPNIATTQLYDHRKSRAEDSPTFKVAY
jgi:hypothetical protein